jgi:DNA replicative helicase MCM subunit Mcm2 (Cdc46/Mcm family)
VNRVGQDGDFLIGITSGTRKDPDRAGWILEAGSLPLKGKVPSIDELDKIKSINNQEESE